MSKTLLLADDSVTIQKVVGISFASEDVELVTVDNGDDALARARELRPDLILADVVMPGLNGYELCEAIKGDARLAHVPVLLLTGTFEAFDEERAQTAGAAGHVAKPFEAQTLVEKVKQLLAAAPAPAPDVAATPAPLATPAVPVTPEAVSAPPASDSSAAGDTLSGGSDEAFDFFDDDLDDLSASAPGTHGESDADLDFESPDSAFAFGANEPAEAPLEAAADAPDLPAVPPPDHTVAILPDEEPPALAVEPVDDLFTPLAGEPEAPIAPLDSAAEDESFDFAVDAPAMGSSPTEDLAVTPAATGPATDDLLAPRGDDDLLRVGHEDLAQATVLDPSGASGYDVSSSDLGEPLASAPTAEGAADATVVALDEPHGRLDSPPPLDMPPLVAEPAPRAEGEGLVSEPNWAEPLEAPEAIEPLSAPLHPEPAARPSPANDAGHRAEAALRELEPELRTQLHDTLEKIAWESMGGVTEKIISDAVGRIERIAWEVIPQLAESMIREEIRRMKGEAGEG